MFADVHSTKVNRKTIISCLKTCEKLCVIEAMHVWLFHSVVFVVRKCFVSWICFRLQVQYEKYALNPPCFFNHLMPEAEAAYETNICYPKKAKLAHEAKASASDPSQIQDNILCTLTADSECCYDLVQNISFV
jgi:hypothetical protein